LIEAIHLLLLADFALVSLPLNKYGKVAVDFCSDQGATNECSRSYMTEEQRRTGQKDQDLVFNGFSGNDTRFGFALCIFLFVFLGHQG